MIRHLPLAVAVLCCILLAAGLVSRRVDLFITRISLRLFGEYVAGDETRRERQRQLLRAAHVSGTHRVYASKTLLYAGIFLFVGSVVGVYLGGPLVLLIEAVGEEVTLTLPPSLAFLTVLNDLPDASFAELLVVYLLSSVTLGAAVAVGTYYARWELLSQRAAARASQIDATLPRTVAFIYALSRSGMAFPAVMNTLAKHEEVYGEAASELAVAVRDMNAFGTDALTALQRTAKRTPSEDLSEFSENLAAVLGSGQSLSRFLRAQYERYQAEAESKQEQYLELLSTFAEAYVTVFVAGPLFFITILVVIGLVLEDTLALLRVMVYLAIPLATFGFVVYVDSVTGGPGSSKTVTLEEQATDERTVGVTDGGSVREGAVDGQWETNKERLAAHDRLRSALDWVAAPVDHVLRNPASTAVITVPIAVIWIGLTAFPVTIGSPTRMIAQVDGAIIGGVAFVLLGYAVVYEIDKRRTRKLEVEIPDFLDRFARINEAGTSIVGSLRRVAGSDLGALTPELRRTERDVNWGADVTTAFHRTARRVRSSTLTRAVALITNSMQASGDIGPVLRIAADETRATERLRRERKQVMLTYLIVIYLSFLVFLGIIAALTVSFIPAIEGANIGATGDVSPDGIAGIGGDGFEDIDVFEYELIFFHASVIQAICSGLVAGQLGEGSVRDGVKHAVILLAITGIAFVLMGL
ncbi:type II secretion system F family protein [Halorubrum vacuolatum]|uniref:Flagellar protein FlaJ n=1 Tax=Halorubrum vacuolatum TaxID=63740 RepID=A0A238VC88_HALVU|nr:type II secretion system F family protein [Halorubrum vacuolatum]SNR31866.1 flagellar protein FlaJ [Halorubrum vacuolatum]